MKMTIKLVEIYHKKSELIRIYNYLRIIRKYIKEFTKYINNAVILSKKRYKIKDTLHAMK